MALAGPDLVVASGAAIGLLGLVRLHVADLDAGVAVALVVGPVVIALMRLDLPRSRKEDRAAAPAVIGKTPPSDHEHGDDHDDENDVAAPLHLLGGTG